MLTETAKWKKATGYLLPFEFWAGFHTLIIRPSWPYELKPLVAILFYAGAFGPPTISMFQQIYPRILKGVRQDYPAVQTNIFLKRWKSKDIIMHNADDWWKLGLKLSPAPLVSLHDTYPPVELLCVDVPFPDPKLSYCKPLPLNKPIFYFFNVT